jgi:hypothetical protein
MLVTELEVLKEYINKNLAKRFIRPLTSLVESLILFVLKKDKKLQLYIDY